MDWSSLAPLVAGFAPKLGGLLGTSVAGPLGGVVGTIAGNAIAGVLGVAPTPGAVAGAITGDPAAQAKIEKFEAEHADALIQQAQVQIAALSQSGETARADIAEVNATIRDENSRMGSIPWWHWRHLLGYVPVGLGLELMVLVPMMALGKVSAPDVTALIGAITPPFTIVSGLLGYVAQDTSRLKIADATGTPPPSMGDTVVAGARSLLAKVRPK